MTQRNHEHTEKTSDGRIFTLQKVRPDRIRESGGPDERREEIHESGGWEGRYEDGEASRAQAQYIKMTETPIPRLIISLSIPTIISMLVSNIYNMADTAFVGQLGTSASGAVGIVFGFMTIIQAVGFMFGQGAGSIISRYLGNRDEKNASMYASTSFFWSLFLGFLIAVFGFLFVDRIVIALGSTPTIAPYAKTYITYILAAAPFMASSFVLNNLLRYEGKASLGMVGMLFGALLNIVGDPILMFGFHLGIAGAGISTALSQTISFFILLSMFLRGKTVSALRIRQVSLHPAVLFNICSTGLPSLLRQGLNGYTTMLLNTHAAVYGDPAVAAMSIVSRIIFFVFSTALGIGQGFQPVSGYNYGAKKYKRLKSAFWFTFALGSSVVFLVSAVMMVFSGNLIGLFRNDPEVVAIGTRALRLQGMAVIFLPFQMNVEMLFQSTGHRIGASVMSLLRSGLFFIPTIILLDRLRGLAGIQEAQPIAYLLGIPVAIGFAVWFFRKLPAEEAL